MTPQPDIDELPRFEFLDAEFARLLREAEPSGKRRRLAGFGIASAVAAVLVVVALVVLGGPSGSESTLGPSNAKAALEHFADATAENEALVAGPGQLLYQRALLDTSVRSGDVASNDSPDTSTRLTQESWADDRGHLTLKVSNDGTTLMRGIAGNNGSFVDKNGDSSPNGPFGGPLHLRYEELLALPRNPEVLLEQAKSLDENGGGTVEALAMLLDIPLPIDLQAALLDAAALVPGAELEEGIKAPTGETLTAVSYGGDGSTTHELLFDPESGAYRGHAIVLADGVRNFESLILRRGVVDAVGEIPQ